MREIYKYTNNEKIFVIGSGIGLLIGFALVTFGSLEPIYLVWVGFLLGIASISLLMSIDHRVEERVRKYK